MVIPPYLIFGYIILFVSLAFIVYYLSTLFLQRVGETQDKKARDSASELDKMFIFIKPKVLTALYIIIPLFVGILFFIFTRKLLIIFLSIIFSFFIPPFIVKQMDIQRRKKFVAQLVDGLLILNSSLKAGLTLVQSLEVLVEEVTNPLSQEISLLVREIKMGIPLEEAFIRLDKRMPSEEMTLITSAVLVARETGGDLTKVFLRLVDTIRDRIRLKEMISTFTIQARLQAFIISFLGPAFFILVNRINPGHFDIMWQTTIGRWLIVIAVFLQIVGMFLIFMFGRITI